MMDVLFFPGVIFRLNCTTGRISGKSLQSTASKYHQKAVILGFIKEISCDNNFPL